MISSSAADKELDNSSSLTKRTSLPCNGYPSNPQPVDSQGKGSNIIAHTIKQEPVSLTDDSLYTVEERAAPTTLDMMKTVSFQRLTVDHSYTKNTQMMGQRQPPPLSPCKHPLPQSSSFLSAVDPESSHIKLPSPVKNDRSLLLVERAEQTLVVRHTSSPTPSLVGFSLLLDTESDSSGDSLSDSAEVEDCWVPLSLVVSVPHSLLQKHTSSVDGDSDQGTMQSSPVASRHRTHKLILPKNGLYIYAALKGAPKPSNSRVQKRRGVWFARDETEQPSGMIGEEEGEGRKREEDGEEDEEEEEEEEEEEIEMNHETRDVMEHSLAGGRENVRRKALRRWHPYVSVEAEFGVSAEY